MLMTNNTHKTASLYEAFEPAEVRRLIQRLEIHHTPKHGSRRIFSRTPAGSEFHRSASRRI